MQQRKDGLPAVFIDVVRRRNILWLLQKLLRLLRENLGRVDVQIRLGQRLGVGLPLCICELAPGVLPLHSLLAVLDLLAGFIFRQNPIGLLPGVLPVKLVQVFVILLLRQDNAAVLLLRKGTEKRQLQNQAYQQNPNSPLGH